MLNRLFRRRETEPEPCAKVRAEPDFDVQDKHLIARGVCLYWIEDGTERKLALRRNLRPADPVVLRTDRGFDIVLMRGGAVEKEVARGLDFGTARDLHRILWNWLGQLCQNGHDPFPRSLTAPPDGFLHDHWPEALLP